MDHTARVNSLLGNVDLHFWVVSTIPPGIAGRRGNIKPDDTAGDTDLV
jgi:hypothetical protein